MIAAFRCFAFFSWISCFQVRSISALTAQTPSILGSYQDSARLSYADGIAYDVSLQSFLSRDTVQMRHPSTAHQIRTRVSATAINSILTCGFFLVCHVRNREAMLLLHPIGLTRLPSSMYAVMRRTLRSWGISLVRRT